MAEARAEGFSGRTAWARNLAAPARAYLQAETGSAGVLLAATIAALVWANVAASTYASFWTAELSVRAGGFSVAHDVRYWVNSGLMTLFFFVVGLEARR